MMAAERTRQLARCRGHRWTGQRQHDEQRDGAREEHASHFTAEAQPPSPSWVHATETQRVANDGYGAERHRRAGDHRAEQ